jgi:hypothetical protein
MTTEPHIERESYYGGQPGVDRHVTGEAFGKLPIEKVRNLPGAMGEMPGEHRNKHGQHWDDFKSDIAEHGIQHPIFIMHDSRGVRLAEGNHRRDAAVELGHTHVPVEVRYFGQKERSDRLFDGRLNSDQFKDWYK